MIRMRRQTVALTALLLCAGCGGDTEPVNDTMADRNLSAKADEMERMANTRANEMAGQMMDDVEPVGIDNLSANDSGAVGDNSN